MVYNGADSLNYVVKYNDGPGLGEWGGWFPIKAKVPKNAILLGAQGNTGAGAISKMAIAAYKAAAELFKPHNFRNTPAETTVEVENMEEQVDGEQINEEENSGEQNNGEGVRHA